MEEKLVALLDEYIERFGKPFPLMQSPEFERAIGHIETSLKENKTVEELFPEIYGSMKNEYR